MSADDRTPVLVGSAAVEQRLEDPERALEPVALMREALERAADDAGSRALLARADCIAVPRGFWRYPDPARLLAEALGAKGARTLLAEIGVLQTSLFGYAARAIREGGAQVVLVAGGEAKHRSRCAQRLGREASFTAQGEVVPDEVLRPAADIIAPGEIRVGLANAVNQYAVIENALRYADGQGLAEHRRELAELWAGFSRVAAANPHAWRREALAPEAIIGPVGGNRMLAFPYTKLHTSQWNVDQAAGMVLCSVAAARAAGVPEERWLFPRAVTESNHMLPLSERAELHRSPGFEVAGRRALELAGASIDGVDHLELYSCFPVAVRVQARELGVPAGRPLTVTGGMAFAGGPLNNFALQALARMVEVLRAEPGSLGLVTAVSGILTKQGVSLWSTAPGEAPFRFEDVAPEVARRTRRVEVAPEWQGPARVASYTVLYAGEIASGVALCDLEDGRRALATSRDPELVRAMTESEFCGRAVRIGAGGELSA